MPPSTPIRLQTGYDRLWDELQPRGREVTALVCLGYTNQEIAQRLTISINTVRTTSAPCWTSSTSPAKPNYGSFW